MTFVSVVKRLVRMNFVQIHAIKEASKTWKREPELIIYSYAFDWLIDWSIDRSIDPSIHRFDRSIPKKKNFLFFYVAKFHPQKFSPFSHHHFLSLSLKMPPSTFPLFVALLVGLHALHQPDLTGAEANHPSQELPVLQPLNQLEKPNNVTC